MRTTITLSESTKNDMERFKEKGLSYEGLLLKMMVVYEKYVKGELRC